MSRINNFKYNTIMGFLNRIVTIISGFILPRVMLKQYGTEINGLVSSITHFIAFISFADFGMTSVVQAALYKPLHDNDNESISKILISSNKFFKKVAIILILYVLLLIFIYPNFVNENFNFGFTASLIVALSVNSFLQYYFCLSYRILLTANQKEYIYLIISCVTLILNTTASVILINLNMNIVCLKFVTALIYIAVPVFLNIYIKKNYKLNFNLTYDKEPIKQKWNGFAQHIAHIMLQNTDITVLTLFSTLANVSIYHVYFLAVNGVYSLISAALTGLYPLLGNIIAGGENKKLKSTFEVFEWMLHTSATMLFTCTVVLIVPFVRVYTKGVTDANYIVPLFGFLITTAYWLLTLRQLYQSVILSAGHFKQTQTSSFIEAGINVIISLMVVIKFGLIGVSVGTISAIAYRTLYLVFYLKKNILFHNPLIFFKNIAVDIIIASIVLFSTRSFVLNSVSYTSWSIMAIKVFLITFLVTFIINVIFNRKMLKSTLFIIKK